MHQSIQELEKAKVNLETSVIAWSELQRFFAAGLAIFVDNSLDLVDVAYQFSIDNKSCVAEWIKAGLVEPVSDQQAIDWLAHDCHMWAVVIRPWVLVQMQA